MSKSACNQEVKGAIQEKIVAARLQNKVEPSLYSRYAEARKSVAFTVPWKLQIPIQQEI